MTNEMPCLGCGKTERPIMTWRGERVCSEDCRKVVEAAEALLPKTDQEVAAARRGEYTFATREDMEAFWASDIAKQAVSTPSFGERVPGSHQFGAPLQSKGILKTCEEECAPHLHQFCSSQCEGAYSASVELARAAVIPLAEAINIVNRALDFFFANIEGEDASSDSEESPAPHNGETLARDITDDAGNGWRWALNGRPIRHLPCDVPTEDITALGDEVEWFQCPACSARATGNRIGHESGE